MGLHRLVIIAAVALVGCGTPSTAPVVIRDAQPTRSASDLNARLMSCLQYAWVRSGPHATPQSLALYNHYAAVCYAKYARES